jgi:cytochrome P450
MAAVPQIQTERAIGELRGPPGLPLIGNAHQIRTRRLHLILEEWCDRYGPVFRFDLGPRRIVGIGELDEINTILRDRPDGFRRWRELKEGSDETGLSGVFVAEGDEWRHQRRLAVTALNSNHLQRYFHVVSTTCERLLGRLRGAARERRAIDIQQELTSYTVDVTSLLAFGHDLNTLERRDNELQGHIQRVIQISGRRLGMPVPYWRWVRLPADRAADRSLEEIRRAVITFIEQARERMRVRPELLDAPENFLEGMLAAQQTEGGFSDEEIIGNTFTMLLAGEDTTAHTIAWTLWFLASRPEHQTRVAHEALEVLGEHRSPVDYETIESLSYCEGVLREAMRLKPVAPMLGVEALADTTVAATRIPAGTRLLLLARHAGLKAVEQGDQFDPGRWLEHGETPRSTPDQKSFLAFGAGPRFCPGRNLAFLESKTALAMIARNFEIELDGGPVTELFGFTTVPTGLRVRLRERARVASSLAVG